MGSEVFVAHAPERIAAGRFLEEIDTLPCIIGGVGEASGEVAGRLFETFGAPIVQTTPVQAELAKIWTNILRYTQFALPNLLMMDCEQYGANVFEVIELINRDYPRGGIAEPGLTAGTCLRKDFAFSEERSNAPGMLLAGLARERVRSALPRRGHASGASARSPTARSRCSGSRSRPTPTTSATRCRHKLVRLLERELADVAVHDPLVPTPTSDVRGGASSGADAVVVATNHSEFREIAAARARSPSGRPPTASSSIRGTAGARASCSRTRASSSRSRSAS